MSHMISWSLQMSVRDGRLDDAKALVSELVEATRSEPGTLTFEFFLSADATACHVYERYADSDAALVHVGNFAANFVDRFLACFEFTSFSVYGPASDELRGALGSFGAAFLGALDGFSR